MIRYYLLFMERTMVGVRWFIFLLVSIITVLVFYQVISRYLVGSTPYFIEELTRYCLIWIAYIASSVALRSGHHVALNVVVSRLPSQAGRFFKKISLLCVLCFLIVLLTGSVMYAINQLGAISTSLHISMFWPALGPIIGTSLMILQTTELLLMRTESGKYHVIQSEGS